jgi:hypothetical protein
MLSVLLWTTAARHFDSGGRSAHARRHDRHVYKGHRRRKLSLRDYQFFDRATLLQAFHQAVERPNIIRMLCAPLNSATQA